MVSEHTDFQGNPQLEDGYTSIANELLEAKMKMNFSPYENRIFECTIRKTYGFHKKTDHISISQFEQATQIPRTNVCRTIRNLVLRNIINKTNNSSRIPEYGVNKHYKEWLDSVPVDTTMSDTLLSDTTDTDTIPVDTISADSIQSDNQIVSQQIIDSVSTDTKNSVSADTHKRNKDTYTKESITKESSNITKTLHKKSFLSFEEYYEKLKIEYADITNYEGIYEKFKLYEELKPYKNRKLAWRNWLDTEREHNRKGVMQYGTHINNNSTSTNNERELNKYTSGKYGKLVQQ